MTTAARPTWAPAKGGQEQGGARMFGPSQKFSARDLASHTVLKTRKEGQGTEEEIRKRKLREELEDKERDHYESKQQEKAVALGGPTSPKQQLLGYESPQKKSKRDGGGGRDSDGGSDSDESSSDDEDEDEDDEMARLQAVVEQIRKERAAEKALRETQKQNEEAKELLRGNPLLNFNNNVAGDASFKVKPRWDDDVVFKNQARGETKQEKRFINDTIRNDFHRKFLNKYMK